MTAARVSSRQSRSASPGAVRSAVSLGSELLLLACSFEAAPGTKLFARWSRARTRAGVEWLDCGKAGAAKSFDKVVAVPGSASRAAALALETSKRETVLGPVELNGATAHLRLALRENLAALDPDHRQATLDLAVRAASRVAAGRSNGLSEGLRELRDGLRERLPRLDVAKDQPRGLSIDQVVAADEHSFYIQGWFMDREADLARLTVVTPEGERVEVGDSIFTYGRPDVDSFYGTASSTDGASATGFIVLVETALSSIHLGWLVEMENQAGDGCEAPTPQAIADPVRARRLILEALPLEALPAQALMEQQVHPAISRLQRQIADCVRVRSVRDYGSVPASAVVSVVVPLYGRVDFVEHQLAEYVHDPELREAEIVYVLDSPELARELQTRATQLHELYRLPFRVVELERSSGFASANEVGVAHSTGRLVLFLNSDVLPVEPGWLSRMVDFYERTPRIGALGPKLVYEDDSLQHAGMYFVLPQDTALARLWANAHYFKGMHRRLPAACVNRPVPAVTGACLMIDRAVHLEVGGFSDAYVQGDHEDSDLCLRLLEAGRENWYLADVELYHLEGQSYPDALRGRMALYNRWLHTELGDATLYESFPLDLHYRTAETPTRRMLEFTGVERFGNGAVEISVSRSRRPTRGSRVPLAFLELAGWAYSVDNEPMTIEVSHRGIALAVRGRRSRAS